MPDRLRGLLSGLRARVSPVAVDAALALGCYLLVVINCLLDEELSWQVSALAAAGSLPLLWRRRQPLLVAAVCGVVTTILSIEGALGPFPAAQLVATYTFAALSPPVQRLLGGAGTVAGVSVSIFVPGDEAINLAPSAMMFVAAYALGTGARARHAQIAMLEERARRLAEEREAAATRERERIAREMHDILAHAMSLVVVQAEAGPVAARAGPERAEQVFDTISATARDALAQLRRTLQVLRRDAPGELSPQPGLAGLRELAYGVRAAGLTVDFREEGAARPVPADVGVAAYRIVQEALTNTLKHAAATSVAVRVRWRDEALELDVRDDGQGSAATPAGPAPGGRGLIGMRERAAAHGGELTCGPLPDAAGFRVAATLPLNGR